MWTEGPERAGTAVMGFEEAIRLIQVEYRSVDGNQ